MSPELVLAIGGLLVSAATIAISLFASRSNVRDQLHERDLKIAELGGQLSGLKDVLDSFARAFIDRRSNLHE